MAITQKYLNDKIRSAFISSVTEFLKANDNEVLVTNSNEIAIPVVDEVGDEKFIVLTFKVPTGSREGDPYDAYSLASTYEMKCKEKAEKAEKAKLAKEKKIARDKAYREAQTKAKEARGTT